VKTEVYDNCGVVVGRVDEMTSIFKIDGARGIPIRCRNIYVKGGGNSGKILINAYDQKVVLTENLQRGMWVRCVVRIGGAGKFKLKSTLVRLSLDSIEILPSKEVADDKDWI
jgi:hypothetical protein